MAKLVGFSMAGPLRLAAPSRIGRQAPQPLTRLSTPHAFVSLQERSVRAAHSPTYEAVLVHRGANYGDDYLSKLVGSAAREAVMTIKHNSDQTTTGPCSHCCTTRLMRSLHVCILEAARRTDIEILLRCRKSVVLHLGILTILTYSHGKADR